MGRSDWVDFAHETVPPWHHNCGLKGTNDTTEHFSFTLSVSEPIRKMHHSPSRRTHSTTKAASDVRVSCTVWRLHTCMPVLGLVSLQGLVSSIKLFGSRTKGFISKVVATLQPCLPSIITLRACARGKAIPSVHRLSDCLSVCKKFFQISYKQILLQLTIVS